VLLCGVLALTWGETFFERMIRLIKWRARLVVTAMMVAALFVPQAVEGVYVGLGREMSDGLHALSVLWLLISVGAWFWIYCREHPLPRVMDMGYFVILLWMLIVPYHVIRSEGLRGVLRIALFLFTYLAAWLGGRAIAIWMRVLAGG